MRWGIASRLGWILASFSVLAAVLAGYYTYAAARDLLRERAERSLLATTQVLTRHLEAGFSAVARDATLLAAAAAVATEPRTAQPPHAPSVRDRRLLAEVFKASLAAHPSYLQIRLISARDHGLELLRVDRLGDDLVEAPQAALQEKAHFPFVFETLKLRSGAVYFSEFGINHEGDATEEQQQPIFNMASPVVRWGTVEAVVVVRVAASPFLAYFRKSLPENYGFYLCNRWGDILVHPDPTQTFGFDRGQRILLQDTLAPVAQIIEGRTHELMMDAQADGAEPRVFSFTRLPVGDSDEDRFLVAGLSQPMAVVQDEVLELGRGILKMLLVLSAVGMLLAALVSRAVTRPLQTMVRAARAFSRGEPHGALPVERQDEVGELARSLSDMEQQITRQIAELNASRDSMAHLAHHDLLTGLPNRRMFEQRLAQALELSRRSGRACALFFVDLDDFKSINDALGHAAGDEVLQATGRAIVSAVRQADTVARLAGDEFTVLCENVDTEEAALQIAEKLQQAFGQTLELFGKSLRVRASIGMSLFPRDAPDAQSLLASADAAMYRVKQSRSNHP
ncbi:MULTISPECIES: GGDEF domain-containing protein [Acidovorax]|uniref:Diguanylate cyclase (GGDEF) domain-containing protein n=1 Tax=Acidovorax soli TaxID=592050 RepID=A0A1H3WQG0_9BURK|nr:MULTISPECIES: GGDEF domain-containing protein [Acidovorax]SDZ89190.1 diguanylate cyclase (GGDEF) domain-containing protein [Acidovorax soli]